MSVAELPSSGMGGGGLNHIRMKRVYSLINSRHTACFGENAHAGLFQLCLALLSAGERFK